MATKRNPAGARQSGTSGAAKNDDLTLPAEPEVTRSATTATTSNPGREPAHLAAARARRQRAIQEETMRREYAQSRNASNCSSSALTGGLKLIGGAGLGAVLMYLLDPEAGRRRREAWSDKASRAASTTGSVLGNAAEVGGNVAGNLWDMTTEAGQTMAHRAAQASAAGAAAASHFGSNLAERAGETAHDLHYGAHRQARSARKTASGWLGHEEKKRYVPDTDVAVSAATALAAGLGLMYLLDPTDGARRRSWLLGKATRCANETGDFFRRTGRHLANRSRGMAHDTQSMFQRDEASDRTVAERIRARLGHLEQPTSDLNVAVVDGRVTIAGRCSPGDVDAVLSTVQGTPGVASIVNLLDVRIAGAPQTKTSAI